MSERVDSLAHDREQLRLWLAETEEDNESVFGVEDENEREIDHVEIQNDNRSEEIDGGEDSAEVHPDDTLNGSSDHEMDFENGVPFVNPEFYLGKDRVTRWYLEPQVPRAARTPRHNIIPFFHRPGPQGNSKNAQSPAMALSCIIDDDMISKVVEYTNIYIDKVRTNFQRDRDARPTDVKEIKALIGILYLAGALKAGRRNVCDMWDNTDGTGVESVYITMSMNRFRFLLRCLRFDNIYSRDVRKAVDKLAAFREFFDQFVLNCKKSYKPTDYLTIDEQLVGFRGNCSFRVYMPSKPAKYGIKVFALVSTTNFYATNLEIYVGTQPPGPYQKSNSTEDLVMRLVEPVAGTNRNITCDNWFTSVPLAKRLREEKQLTLIATLRKNKREVPPNFLPNPDREVKSSIFGFQKNCTIVSYVPKRNKAVLMISTMHDDTSIDPETGPERKPMIISSYNDTKYGVDILDKMCRQYDASRNSKRWPLTLFFHVLNVGGVNAMTIYKANKNIDFINRLDFLKNLSFELMKPQMEHRITLEMIPKQIKARGKLLLKLDDGEAAQPHPQPPRTATTGRCYLCGRARNKTTRKSCIKCHKWVCVDHLQSVCIECLD